MAFRILGAFIACLSIAVVSPVMAQPLGPPIPSSPAIPAVAEHTAVPLYGESNPGSGATETWFKWYEGQVVSVRNVTYPTLTPILPDPAKANGAAIIVAPGGAFEFLSMEHEGWDIAHALAARGVAAFVVKYRTKPTPADQDEWMGNLMRQIATMSAATKQAPEKTSTAPATSATNRLEFSPATADALAALSLVRANASRWKIDPRRVGMIGFSAGAAATLSAVLSAEPGQGPDFIGLIYGPMNRVQVPSHGPPLFAALAIDDPLFRDFSLIPAWHEAGRPVELHLYQNGGHGFGLGRPGTSAGMMIDEFMTWLTMQGFVSTTGSTHRSTGRK